ncbi:helix-turn-helix transcriptional regulator [Arcobacter peruensis]|uniref:helix-turn-helix transcriptional regulator n=1 Tax=Arcobacter peruensis TaxID=2320140 RepID=UPI000F07777B|nr:helix-turn-helix domain-containing protein [Arcobacter peruensis]
MTNTQPFTPKYIRIKDLVKMYGISRSSVYNLIADGKIRPIKISDSMTIYSVEELDNFIKTAAK